MKGSSFKNQLNDRRKERMKRRRREYYFTLFLVSPSTAIIIKQVSLSQSSRDWKPSKPLEEGWGKRQVPLDFHQNERLQESREGKRRKEKSGRWTWVMSRDGVEGKPHASSFHVLSHFPFLGIFFAKELLKSLDTKHLWLSSPSFSLSFHECHSLSTREKREEKGGISLTQYKANCFFLLHTFLSFLLLLLFFLPLLWPFPLSSLISTRISLRLLLKEMET